MGSQKQNQPKKVRLQKHLASCGIGSRRACEKIIDDGLVSIDGLVIDCQGVTVDPTRQKVSVNGKPVEPQQSVYFVMNKPRDVLCTSSDPDGRRIFRDLLSKDLPRLFTVGRLDRNSEGLLLLTNDGNLAAQLIHPRYHVPKTYLTWLDKELTSEQRKQLKKGIVCDGEMLSISSIRPINSVSDVCCYEIVLHEGKNRQLRRLFEAIGINVIRLLRTKMGPLQLDRLRSGQWRSLTKQELFELQNIVRPTV